jgi:hypothetical protein
MMDISYYWRLKEKFSLSEAIMLIIEHNPFDVKKMHDYNTLRKKYEAEMETAEDSRKGSLSAPSIPDYDADPSVWKEKYQVLIKILVDDVLSERLKTVDNNIEEKYIVENSRLCPVVTVDTGMTTVSAEDLKEWLRCKGIHSNFFFGDVEKDTTTAYLNPEHEHYAPKLAAAVNAWLAVTENQELLRNRNPKQAIDKWLRKNADRFGLTKDDGSPNELGIKEVSKVANWKLSGTSKIGN